MSLSIRLLSQQPHSHTASYYLAPIMAIILTACATVPSSGPLPYTSAMYDMPTGSVAPTDIVGMSSGLPI